MALQANLADNIPQVDITSDSLLNMKATRELIFKIRDINKKFRVACSQLILLNNAIDEAEVRYHRAQDAERRSYRYTLRLKLCTLEGVRNMFYEYASSHADELEKLQMRLYREFGIVWSESLAEDSFSNQEDEPIIADEDESTVDEESIAEDNSGSRDESENYPDSPEANLEENDAEALNYPDTSEGSPLSSC